MQSVGLQQLQMSFKALNDSVGPNGLIPTLLVFGAYPQMAEIDALLPTIIQRTIAIKKAIEKVQKSKPLCQVNNALNTWNRPFITLLYDLLLNFLVLIYCKGNAGQSESWKEPYKLLSSKGEPAIVELQSMPIKFRTTTIKSYYNAESPSSNKSPSADSFPTGSPPIRLSSTRVPLIGLFPTEPSLTEPSIAKLSAINQSIDPVTCSHGRLREVLANASLDNLPSTEPPIIPPTKPPIVPFILPAKQDRGRPRKYSITQVNLIQSLDFCFIMNSAICRKPIHC